MRNGAMAHLKSACGPPVGHGPQVGNHWTRPSDAPRSSISISISLFRNNYKQTANHARENKPH